MTDNNHPITPPPELVYRLQDLGNLDAIELAYQAGADLELEACCEHLKRSMSPRATIDYLRAARRPNPPSLKEQALEALNEAVYMSDDIPPEGISTDQADTIRRALESLPD